MSRRRQSLDERENDTLFEFENFKKKFLLANKHITKLNSTLSVRIEELNTQIASLQSQNILLRTTLLTKDRELVKEREKSRNIMLNAENAVDALSRHLGNMRVRFDVPQKSSPKKDAERKKEKVSVKVAPKKTEDGGLKTPPKERLARAPTEPGIEEGEEPESPSPSARRKTRLEAPKALLPSRPVSAASMSQPIVLSDKKSSRRPSGLVVNTSSSSISPSRNDGLRPSSPNPLFGSPVKGAKRLAANDYAEVDEIAHVTDEEEVEVINNLTNVSRRKSSIQRVEDSTRGRKKARNSSSLTDTPALDKVKRSLKDVTNSPHLPAIPSTLPPIDDEDIPSLPVSRRSFLGSASSESESAMFVPAKKKRAAPSVQTPTPPSSQSPPSTNLSIASSPSPAEAIMPSNVAERRESSPFMTQRMFEKQRDPSPPRRSSSPPASDQSETGRATRTRKSVNYAEPKLNTKMRKPESAAPAPAKKRASAAAALPSMAEKEKVIVKPRSASGGDKPRSSGTPIPPPLRSVAAANDEGDTSNAPPEDEDEYAMPSPIRIPHPSAMSTANVGIRRKTSKASSVSSSGRSKSRPPSPTSSSGDEVEEETRQHRPRQMRKLYDAESDNDGWDNDGEADSEYVPPGRSRATPAPGKKTERRWSMV